MNKQYCARGEKKMPTKIKSVILYSVPEVSHMLDVTTGSIQNYIDQGYLNTKHVMGKCVVAERELRTFFEKLSFIQAIY